MEQLWEQLVGRLDGPLVLRFVLQPLVAAALAVRAGLKDAKSYRAPYLWTVLSDRGQRPQLLRDGFKDVAKVFVLATVLDITYQVLVFGWVYPVQALLIAALLALVPYACIRGPVTRMASRANTVPMSHR